MYSQKIGIQNFFTLWMTEMNIRVISLSSIFKFKIVAYKTIEMLRMIKKIQPKFG